jgi:hypothetical protein
MAGTARVQNTIAPEGTERTESAPEFAEFFEFFRNRDPQAVDRLLRWLDPWLRAVIRVRLVAHRVREIVSVSDVFQSLMKDFVGRASRSSSEPERKVEMERYLAAAVEKKIRARLRKERRQPVELDTWQEAKGCELPTDRIAEGKDFVASIRRRLDPDSQQLLELRMQGFTWPELSGMVGGNSDALRMRLRRSVAAAIYHVNRKEIAGDR